MASFKVFGKNLISGGTEISQLMPFKYSNKQNGQEISNKCTYDVAYDAP